MQTGGRLLVGRWFSVSGSKRNFELLSRVKGGEADIGFQSFIGVGTTSFDANTIRLPDRYFESKVFVADTFAFDFGHAGQGR